MDRRREYPPTLLYRLQDDEPKSAHDRQVVVDARGMRTLVQKDLADLLNHTNIEDQLDEGKHQIVMGSVVNYGVPALTGRYENHHSWSEIEKTIRTTILRFEPRIMPESLLVRSIQEEDGFARHAVIHFEIQGLIYWRPKPIDLSMSGRYDIESEKVELKLV